MGRLEGRKAVGSSLALWAASSPSTLAAPKPAEIAGRRWTHLGRRTCVLQGANLVDEPLGVEAVACLALRRACRVIVSWIKSVHSGRPDQGHTYSTLEPTALRENPDRGQLECLLKQLDWTEPRVSFGW
jgi:hypothetical protein